MRVETLLLNPSLDSAYNALAEAIAKKRLIIILGQCSVDYEGRGASRLGPGDRLIIVKPDGAVLVHRPTGYSPVNWQPESHTLTSSLENGRLVLRSVREKPREHLVVLFEKVYLIAAIADMVDKAEFIEYMDEGEIRDYLYEHPEEIEEGLRPLAKEKPVGDGYADIYAVDRNGVPVIIEVKRVTAGPEAVRQLKRYVDVMAREAGERVKVRGILVAPAISKDARLLLQSLGLEFRQINLQLLRRKTRRKTVARREKQLWEFLLHSSRG